MPRIRGTDSRGKKARVRSNTHNSSSGYVERRLWESRLEGNGTEHKAAVVECQVERSRSGHANDSWQPVCKYMQSVNGNSLAVIRERGVI